MWEGKKPKYIITIGASAGGLKAINELVSQIKHEWNIAVFIVIHLSKTGLGDFLVHRLQKYTTLTCSLPQNGQKIEANNIYIAPPDKHLLMKDDSVIIADGPAENRWRPSIDVLLRAAAVHYNNRAIGIILTGYLNDGMAGMSAIKRSGGFTIVQDPNEAEYPDMPLAVLNNMEVDYCVTLSKMGESLETIIKGNEERVSNLPEELVKESAISENSIVSLDAIGEIGEKSLFVCPDCGGGLWNVKNEFENKYRCHVGHAYLEPDLIVRQAESLENTLWMALRMMEERRVLLKSISKREEDRGYKRMAGLKQKQVSDLVDHINNLKQLLFSIKKNSDEDGL